jgi:hypothetical protein
MLEVGDIVRVQSWEWIRAQEKDDVGDICGGFIRKMFGYAGRVARITHNGFCGYSIDIDGGDWKWHDLCFDSDFDPYAPLSAEEALRAMLDKEILWDQDGWSCAWDGEDFVKSKGENRRPVHTWGRLHREPVKSALDWTRWRILAWVNSVESHGWLVRRKREDGPQLGWRLPTSFSYDRLEEGGAYQRARMLPDHSGIDEATIQGFEVEG